MIPYVDLHCDTLMTAWMAKKGEISRFSEAMVDVERLKQAGCMAQFFAVYMLPKEEMTVPDDQYIAELREILLNSCGEDLALARNYEDLRRHGDERRISAFLTLEDGRAVEGSMERLEAFYEMGFRLISLTWNFENCFGFPNSRDRAVMERGLKPFGKDAVARMQELGMLVDVSHLSDGGFWDVAELAKRPFVASHSNCRAINPHPRSMTDEMIRALADHGGVMGLNFCPAFLTEDVRIRESRIEAMVRQVRHMVNVGGMEIAAIGSDLDGIEGDLEIGSPEKMELLFQALHRDGFTEDQLERFAFRNALAVLREVG